MKKKAFLSGLGVMGRRHLLGLLRGGFDVHVLDPRRESVEAGRELAAKLDGASERFHPIAEPPKGDFDVAVFAETAPYRLVNLSRFLEGARAARMLVEKPLTNVPEELAAYAKLFGEKGMAAEEIQVNLSRRTWDVSKRFKEAVGEKGFTLTVNGGATGFGCNGIHHLDLFLWYTGHRPYRVAYARLSPEPIGSGRGAEFGDVGVSFVIESGRDLFHCSLTAESSAAPITVMKSEHFIGWFDEGDVTYRIKTRKPESQKPNYLCGHDYRIVHEGTVPLPAMDQLSLDWAEGRLQLPSFEDGLKAHGLLFDILAAANAPKPYRFT